MQKIKDYFTKGIESQTMKTFGAEVETQFVDKNSEPISAQVSQQMIKYLVSDFGWSVLYKKNNIITALVDLDGNRIFYELGRHNIEVATIALELNDVLNVTKKCLDQLNRAAKHFNVKPYHHPIVESNDDLLIIPDERDAVWLELDGRNALKSLACISSVQFTISVSPQDAIRILNNFGKATNAFLEDFPQSDIWKKYITESFANYRTDRYGGPLFFDSLDEYCLALTQHDVVQGVGLVPFTDVKQLDTPLYLRSIWWHFRLKRYENSLCIEIRPMARRGDDQLPLQFERVLEIFNS